jgi:ABC-type branched-subunit amino acid transport system substrate-binding protein
MAAAVAAAAIPLIGPLTSRPRQDFPLNRYVFYLTPGLAEQANALVEFAARQLPPEGGKGRPLVVVRPETAEMAGIAGAVATAARGRGFTTIETAASATPEAQAKELAGRLGEGGAAALLLLDNGRAVQELLRLLQALGWRPLILLPASLPGEDPFTVAPAALADRLYISLSVLPPDRTPGAAVDYRHLAAAHPLPTHHVAAQMTALAAAEVLIEGLKRAGRDVSREKLIATLEKLYRFDAGLGAPVSFGPNRRVGERGAYVAALDFVRHSLGPQAPWIELEP